MIIILYKIQAVKIILGTPLNMLFVSKEDSKENVGILIFQPLSKSKVVRIKLNEFSNCNLYRSLKKYYVKKMLIRMLKKY